MQAPSAASLRQGMRAVFGAALSAAFVLAFSGAPAAATEPAAPAPSLDLLMLEEEGCAWCAKWDAEIAEVYPKTDEGRRAPLRRQDIHEKSAASAALTREARYTPTFVLLREGREVGRIEGYPGEDFFWPLLARLIAQADADETPGAAR